MNNPPMRETPSPEVAAMVAAVRAHGDMVRGVVSARIAELEEELRAATVSAGRLREAAQAMLERYVQLVSSGDCGNWDPHDEQAVKDLCRALSAEEG